MSSLNDQVVKHCVSEIAEPLEARVANDRRPRYPSQITCYSCSLICRSHLRLCSATPALCLLESLEGIRRTAIAATFEHAFQRLRLKLADICRSAVMSSTNRYCVLKCRLFPGHQL